MQNYNNIMYNYVNLKFYVKLILRKIKNINNFFGGHKTLFPLIRESNKKKIFIAESAKHRLLRMVSGMMISILKV